MQRSEGAEVNFCFIPKGKGRMVGQSREVKTLVACLLSWSQNDAIITGEQKVKNSPKRERQPGKHKHIHQPLNYQK